METRSRFCPPSAAAEAVELSAFPLSLDELVRRFEDPEHGAVVSFCGVVRGSENGSPIGAIVYEAYPGMALKALESIAREAALRWRVIPAIAHRTGRVAASEAGLIVVVRGAHRREAFEACEFIVEQIKARAAIWKTEYEWTGAAT